jgi:uncharacterized protein with FMN-binding domain
MSDCHSNFQEVTAVLKRMMENRYQQKNVLRVSGEVVVAQEKDVTIVYQ